jgi:hypothetical protein
VCKSMHLGSSTLTARSCYASGMSYMQYNCTSIQMNSQIFGPRAKVKAFMSTSESADFAWLWVEISNDPSVPESFVQYMRSEWLPEVKMWLLVMRKNCSIFEEGDTNMLLEAYVFHSQLR